ncbi:hypothetical protein M426DRAFT_20804 [Hypoxylon sp. CI-4A]|nr:hypothetical protein M426DRAFT_20804 [Hypoxylon sp. CI-4A]
MVTPRLLIALGAFAGNAQAAAISRATSRDGNDLVQPVYKALDLGSIKPLGWFKDQLELEAEGLSGNMFDFYRFVHDSRYLGGSFEYSGLSEASPYWFNGLVPLAFGLGDDRILSQVKYYLDYILDHQQEDGWIGWETTQATRGLWARCLLLLGLIQYAEADPTETDRIVDAMYRYVELAHSMLQNNYTGLIWLLERYPRNNTDILWETMDLMIDGGVLPYLQWGADWRTFWTDEAYPKVLYEDTPFDLSWVFIHGVNMAQATYHRSLAGTILADEYIADLNPSRGAELCIAAEVMFSSAYIYQYLGDDDIADWAEQTAFNAFPVSVSADWWSHQYVQQENQPWSRNLTTDDLWWDVDSYGNVFGLEPNYPCCTVNHPQAYPKFLANSFAKTADNNLAHVFLIPGTAAASLGPDNSNAVFVTANTTYPFGHTITYDITATSPFDFYVRIPTWANTSKSTISTRTTANTTNNNTQPLTLTSNPQSLQKIAVPAGSSTATLRLATTPRVVQRANHTAAIYHGALLYALAIEHDERAASPIQYHSADVLPLNTTDPEGRTRDYVLTPKPGTVWNVAIDPTQIQVVRRRKAGETSSFEVYDDDVLEVDADDLENPIWELGAPPVELRVAAVEIDWPTALDTAADPGTFDVKPKGKPFAARFVPYGSSKLHMALLPVLELDDVDLSV